MKGIIAIIMVAVLVVGVVLVTAAPAVARTPEDVMTGSGIIGTSRNPSVAHAFALHGNKDQLPNMLLVVWGRNHFWLDTLTMVNIADDPTIDPRPPVAGFDTMHGRGVGKYNGVYGYQAEFIFTDAGEPGRNDWAWIKIAASNGDTIMEVSGFLRFGTKRLSVYKSRRKVV